MAFLPRSQFRCTAAVCILVSCAVSLSAALVFYSNDAHSSVFGLANLVGGTVNSLLHGRGITVLTDAQGTAQPLLYRAARMPVAPLTVAAGTLLFGEHQMLLIALFKTVMFLIPVWASMMLALKMPGTHAQQKIRAALLLLPFAAFPFLADVVNLQVEEGYSYALVTSSFALLLFRPSLGNVRALAGFVIPLALSLDLLYLSKSSMLPAVAVLLGFALVHTRSAATKAVLLMLVLAAPLGWALHQAVVSGHASTGTSLDGFNLHKGQNERFLERYPTPPGSNLDRYDADLSEKRLFQSEWAFNDFHKRATVAFVRQHPAEAARGVLSKASVLFISMRKIGSSAPGGSGAALLETFGMLVLRIALWAAVFWAATQVLSKGHHRSYALLFLWLVAACASPYLLGFAYTRHVSILLYPSILLLCRFIGPKPDHVTA